MLLFLAAGVYLSGQAVPDFFAMFSNGWGNHTIVVREVREMARLE